MNSPAFTIVAGVRWPSAWVWELRGPDGRTWHRTARKQNAKYAPASLEQMRQRYQMAYEHGRKDADADTDSMPETDDHGA